MKLKKEIKMIIALMLLLVVLSGGIFVGLKGNIFSSNKDKVVEKSKRTDSLKKDDNKDEKENQSENDSDVKDEENLDVPETPEEPKQEETKKNTQTTVPEVPKNIVISTPKAEDKVVVKPTVEEKKKETPTEENPEVPTVPAEPETPKLDIPNGGVLTFSELTNGSTYNLTDTVVGVFDTRDGYINSYKETITIDYFSLVNDINDETRPLYEEAFRESFTNALGDEAKYYTITSSSRGVKFDIIFTSDRDRLKSLDASEFTTTGFYYYDNFKATFIREGYTSD